ncbi:C-C motif chemokine 4 homolog [Silurus meridionalis]|uniref:C-C motif chemokine 4 homolog n=1 Tax=Silurus meridionalis TaxID=175797 RepID=UPI001EEBBF02|nr:C-C motif chemokine 4 homolog [Silurus meridionalis]
MSSPSFLMVLLVLTCFQSFMLAQNAIGAGLCCFEFHKRPISAANVVSVEETTSDCTIPGVVFTTKKGFQICADPEVDWVKEIIKIKKLNVEITDRNVPDSCCIRYQSDPIPIRVITGYKVSDHLCTKPAVIFFLRNSSEVCGDPELDWVQRCMRRIDQMEYNIMMQTSNSSSQS